MLDVAAIYAIFLYKYFGQKIFCVAYPVNMRVGDTGKEILCSLINMQLLFVELLPDSSFWQIYQQIVANRNAISELTLPYEKIIYYLKQQNAIVQSDSANIVLSETDLKLKSINFSDLQVTSVQMPKNTLPYDISLEYECHEDDIYLQLAIKKDWFNPQDQL